jgi:hypothetical protein
MRPAGLEESLHEALAMGILSLTTFVKNILNDRIFNHLAECYKGKGQLIAYEL